jgi:hypothetical protein
MCMDELTKYHRVGYFVSRSPSRVFFLDRLLTGTDAKMWISKKKSQRVRVSISSEATCDEQGSARSYLRYKIRRLNTDGSV